MNLFPWVIKKIQGNYLKEIVILSINSPKINWQSTIKGNFNKFSNTLEPIMRQCMNLDET